MSLLPSIDLDVLKTFLLLWLVIVPTPGPNQLMVTHVAMTRPASHVAAAILGNLVGILLLAGAALLGWAAMLELFPWLRRAVTLLGALYLGYLGYRLIARSLIRAGTPTAADVRDDAVVPRRRHAFLLGVVTALSNTQAIIFITSIYAVTGVLDASLATGLSTLAIIAVCNAAYLGLMGWLFQRAPVRAAYARFRPYFERTIGALFILLGGRLLYRELAA